jgi:hypothetical protein
MERKQFERSVEPGTGSRHDPTLFTRPGGGKGHRNTVEPLDDREGKGITEEECGGDRESGRPVQLEGDDDDLEGLRCCRPDGYRGRRRGPESQRASDGQPTQP